MTVTEGAKTWHDEIRAFKRHVLRGDCHGLGGRVSDRRMKEEGKMLGWHFLNANRRLRTGELVEAGRSYTAEGALVMCQNGMHASRRALDALMYAPGPIVCRVRLLGEMLQKTDKAVARTRRVLWMANATFILHDFALSVATDALLWTDTTDPRLWAVLDVKDQWLRGQATDQELAAAKVAAEAARAAAWAARDATWAARAAAEAARAAAWAARAATWAARAAAWAAGEAAEAAGEAAEAAGEAAWAAYNVQLETMLESLSAEGE